jgi:hypothetical protein
MQRRHFKRRRSNDTHHSGRSDADALIADLRQRVALHASNELGSDDQQQYHDLQRRISVIESARSEMAMLVPKMAPIEEWIRHLLAWRAEFAEELLAPPSDGQTRERQARAKAAIEAIDQGVGYWPNGAARLPTALADRIKAVYPPSWDLRNLDPWEVGYGSLPDAEARLAQLRQRYATAEGRLALAMREPPSE